MDLIGWAFLAVLILLIAIAAHTKHWRYLLIGVGIAGLAACMTSCKHAPVVTKTETVEVVQVRYVRIPDKLTAPVTKAEGPLNQVIDVAKKRGEAIEACNGKLAEIAGIEGTKPC